MGGSDDGIKFLNVMIWVGGETGGHVGKTMMGLNLGRVFGDNITHTHALDLVLVVTSVGVDRNSVGVDRNSVGFDRNRRRF